MSITKTLAAGTPFEAHIWSSPRMPFLKRWYGLSVNGRSLKCQMFVISMVADSRGPRTVILCRRGTLMTPAGNIETVPEGELQSLDGSGLPPW
jgi:hypothetical protein